MRIFFLLVTLPAALLAQTPAKPPAAKPVAPAAKPAAAKPAAAKPAAAKPAAKPAESAAAKPATGFEKVIITVGTETVTVGQFEQLIEGLPEQYRANARGIGKRQLLEQLIQRKLLAQEAVKRKLDQKPETLRQLAMAKEGVLAGAAFQDVSNTINVDEAAARKYYDEHHIEFENVNARHILVRFQGSPVPVKEGGKDLTEAEALEKAKGLIQKLESGQDFAALAKAESDDAGSGANGGDLGNFRKGQMVPAFETAAFSLPVGKVSEPVKSQFGYHIIKVEKHEQKTFDELRPEMEKKMRPDMARQFLDDLRKNSTVVVDEAYFGPQQ